MRLPIIGSTDVKVLKRLNEMTKPALADLSIELLRRLYGVTLDGEELFKVLDEASQRVLSNRRVAKAVR